MINKLKNRFYLFLRWSEKYTKTDMVYLAKGAFWLNFATAMNSLLSLALVYVFGNYLDPEIYGNYRYILSVYGLLSIVTLTGFNTAVARSIARGNDGDLIKGLKIQTLASLLGSALSFALSLYYLSNQNNTLGLGLLLVGLALPLMEPATISGSMLNGKKLFKAASIISTLSQLVTTLTIIVVVLLRKSLFPILITYFISWSLCRLIFLVLVKKRYQKNNLTSDDLFRNGWHFSTVNFLSSIANQLDKILLFHYVGARDLALFSFAIAPVEQIKSLFKNFNTLALPSFSNRTEKDLRQNLNRKIISLGLLALITSLVYIIFAPILIKTFLPKYVEITMMSQVFALSLIGVMIIPMNAAMKSIPKIKALYFSNILSPITSIVLVVILIPPFGLWGAILAKAIGRMIIITENLLIFNFVKD